MPLPVIQAETFVGKIVTQHGFDRYYGIPYSNDMGRQAGRVRPDLPPLPLMQDEEVLQQQPDQAALTERYVEQSIRFIRENRRNPFFLYLAHMHVHLPIFAAERFLRQSRNGLYGAAVECIDWSTNVLLQELRRQGLEENTLVIFTSDNGSRNDGQGSNGVLRGRKGTTWEGGMRVPCIMYWPGKIPAGSVCREIATGMDLMPTLVNLAGGDMPSDRMIDGKDIGHYLLGRGADVPVHRAFYYYHQNCLEAVRCGQWKLHVRKGSEPIRELYDLQQDLGETVNLYDGYPGVVGHLEALLDECRADLGDEATGAMGRNCRPIGRVENPQPLTIYDETYPYMCSLYDLSNQGS